MPFWIPSLLGKLNFYDFTHATSCVMLALTPSDWSGNFLSSLFSDLFLLFESRDYVSW